MEQEELYDILKGTPPANISWYYGQEEAEAFWRRAALSPALQEDMDEIRAEGRRLEQEPLPALPYSLFAVYARTGSRLEYERVYFERRRRLNTYALLALLAPEQPEHLERLMDIAWEICGEYTWCLPAHLPADHDAAEIAGEIDLFSAETGFALSEITLLLGDRLPALLRSRIRQETERRLFRPFLACGPYGWETATHNWAAVCAGSVGAAALLALDDPERLSRILERTERSMSCYLSGFGEDGACLEGLGYWNYGFGYYTYYNDLLRCRTGGRIDGLAGGKARSIAAFQQKCFIGGSFVVNFSDSQPEMKVHRGLSHYLAARYPEVERPPAALRAAYTEDHCSRWAPALRNLLWTRDGVSATRWNDASHYLPDAAWLVSRHTAEGRTFGFAAKGGHNAEPHNHNDLGSFILLGGGDIFLADLGCGEYTADYFGSGRYAYDCNGSQGHSVPVVDGRLQQAGPQFRAEVLHAQTEPDRDELTLELAAAYNFGGLKSLVRSLVWHKDGAPRLELADEFRMDAAPERWTERFVTWLRPDLLSSGTVLLPGMTGSCGGVEVRYDPALVEPEIAAHEFRDHFGVVRAWHTLDFHVIAPESSGRIAFTFQFV